MKKGLTTVQAITVFGLIIENYHLSLSLSKFKVKFNCAGPLNAGLQEMIKIQ